MAILKTTEIFLIDEEDIKHLIYLEKKLIERLDYFFDEVSYNFDDERYENDGTGFRLFFETFKKFMDEIQLKETEFNYTFSDSDSD